MPTAEKAKILVLRHPRFAGLNYGPDNDIIFGNRAGLPDHMAHVHEDHPLLPGLLERYPDIVVGDEKARPDVVYICSDHRETEFRTKQALAAHLRTKAHQPDAEDDDGAEAEAEGDGS